LTAGGAESCLGIACREFRLHLNRRGPCPFIVVEIRE
jgi:hypothetical protein